MNSLHTAKRFVFPLLGLWVLLYASFSLFTPPLFDGADAVQAEAAREMAVNNHWITPHVNEAATLAVSPLLTWSAAAGFKLLGVSDWAARLVVALFALALFIVVMALGTRLFLTPTAGFYAALILLTSAGIFGFAHLLYPQILSTLWLALAMYFFWRSLRHEHASRGTAVGFAAVCALGALSQGLAGVVVPVVIVLLFLSITRNLRHLLRWHPVIAVVIFLLIAAPWHIAVHRAMRIGLFHVSAPGWPGVLLPLLEWAFLLLWILPWCFFAVAGLAKPHARIVPRYPIADCAYRDCASEARLLLVLWLVVVALTVVFPYLRMFSVLPALPALALLAAGWLTADEAAPSSIGRIFAWIFFVAGVLMAAAALLLEARAPFPAPGTDIATLLHLHPGGHHLFVGYLSDLTSASMGLFRIPLSITAAALLVGVAANLFFRLKNQARMANCFLAGMMVFLLIAAQIALSTFSPVISSAVLAEAIKPEVGPSDVVIVNGLYRDASAMGFYLERPIRLLASAPGAGMPSSNVNLTSAIAAGPYETPGLLAEQWSGTGRVFLWTTTESAPTLPGTAYLIARDGGKEILSNQPNSGGASF
jgi:4-amino-4-deoxy-L-arabinose transferase-like glycosyltransferase